MSDGLKMLSSIVTSGAAGTLLGLSRDVLIDSELVAYDFIRSHYRTYRELPTVQTVQQDTGVRLPAASEPLQFYVDRVNERHEYNLIRDRFAVFRDGISRRDMAVVAETVSDMSRVLRRRRRGSSQTGEAISIADGLSLVGDRLNSIRGTGGVSGITTGWERYDAITGGYQKADLITLVARMGMGKTYLALQQAKKAHDDGESVLFVTTEMGTEQIARRYAALSLGINPHLLKTGCISTYMEHRISALVNGVVGADRFKIFSVGMNARVSSIEALCQEFGPTFVVIDGVYLLKPTDMGRNMSRTDKVTAVFDELKGLNLDVDIPFLVTTQFNRVAGKGGKEGSLENIGYTDAVGTHSSIVVAAKFGPSENPKQSRVFDFLKGREGESGEVAINFKFAPIDMSEMTDEEREAGGEVTDDSVSWMGA